MRTPKKGKAEAKRPTTSRLPNQNAPSSPYENPHAQSHPRMVPTVTRNTFSQTSFEDARTTALITEPCPRGQPPMKASGNASSTAADHSRCKTFTRQRHPGLDGRSRIDISMEGTALGKALVSTTRPGSRRSVDMTLEKHKGGWHAYCGPAVTRQSRTKHKGRLCRLCYIDYLGKGSYSDIQENCPACFLRLYDLSNKFRTAHKCANTTRTHASTTINPNQSSAVHPPSGGASAASAVATTSPPAHTGVKGGPYPRHTAAIRRIIEYLNLRSPGCLDVLYVHDNFNKYLFLRNGTRQTTGRRTIGIVEYTKNGQVAWGVLKKYFVPGEIDFNYDGVQPIDSVECKHPEISNASTAATTTSAATTTCEYYSSTWFPQPRAIIAALELSGFHDARIDGVYMFAGYRPSMRKRTSGKRRQAKRNQDSPYFESTAGLRAGLRVFPDEMGNWHVCSDDRVLVSSSNTGPAWNPGKPSLDGKWVLRKPSNNTLRDRWSVPGLTASEAHENSPRSKCRPVSPEDEYRLTGHDLRAIIEMKSLHALGVAMGGEREFNCKYLQWNPKAGSKRQDENERMKTERVRLTTPAWTDSMLRDRVCDFVFVEVNHLAPLQAAGSEIYVWHPDGAFLCKGKLLHLPQKQTLVVYFVNSDIPRANGSQQDGPSRKRGSSGTCFGTNVKRSRHY